MQAIIELPNELKALLGIILTMCVTEILKWLGWKLNVDLSGYAAQVTASLVGAVLGLINAVFSNVPAEFAPIVQSLLGWSWSFLVRSARIRCYSRQSPNHPHISDLARRPLTSRQATGRVRGQDA